MLGTKKFTEKMQEISIETCQKMKKIKEREIPHEY